METVIQLCFRLKQARAVHEHAHAHMGTRTRTWARTRASMSMPRASRLWQAVGSHALTVGSGFEHLDAMQIAKFAVCSPTPWPELPPGSPARSRRGVNRVLK